MPSAYIYGYYQVSSEGCHCWQDLLFVGTHKDQDNGIGYYSS